jgi:hypothetical protein
MPYQVQFAGLICFYRENGSRLALAPDGTKEKDPKDRHDVAIVVEETQFKSQVGWKDNVDLKRIKTPSGRVAMVFTLPACSISLPGADVSGSLIVSDHDNRIPRLNLIQPKFRIDPPLAQAMARVPIRSGKLTGYRRPGTIDNGKAAIISQLDVLYDYDITIRVNFDRTIDVKAGTEVALVNVERMKGGKGDHFKIYEKLAVASAPLSAPSSLGLGIPASSSNHVFFAIPGGIGADVMCTNTGCCG